ncbi:MAG: hypothetical protein LBS74_00635 [Oscillospiraceae bacterium]|jgi:hypothetical protein|nr:hypothetical protein [Oscillospiraceae bacterium]
MKKSKVIISISAAAVVVIALLAAIILRAGGSLDVLRTNAMQSFDTVLSTLPAKGSAEAGWSLSAPEGGAVLKWDNSSISLTVDAKPFIAAGLEASKLENFSGGEIVYSSPAFDMLNQNIKATASDQFKADIKSLRKRLGYHGAMDHYNIEIENGTVFEWAKDLNKHSETGEKQDKDIVFALNPEPLIAAGLKPENVEGWAYAQVPVEIDGKMTEVWKLLKIVDLV